MAGIVEGNRRIRDWLGLKGKRLDDAMLIRPAKAKSAIVRISSKGEHSVCLTIPDMTTPSHSLLMLPDETAIYLNTTSGTVVHFKPNAGNILSSTKVTEGFLRGAMMLSERSLLLGSNNDLITFDLTTRSVTGQFRITQDPSEAVYDIKTLPSHYALPPLSLAEHFSQATGFPNAAALIESRNKL